ncbi:O-antigen ligase family protein [Pararhizobium sp.]|uniref:O-antigen ligase family protein n=1 Tax=Pararhizobium sp. TaxID=1977563 RepID=UPI002717A39F|nr:O-antigen ligase family protein [Pararhizobium sp.]MDO9418028.1 O-antigen ligase family protein [Pararhizobium sp.]
MPMPIIIIAALALLSRLAMGGYHVVKPALFIVTVSALAIGLFLYALKKDVRAPIEKQMLVIVVTMPVLAWSAPNLPLLFLFMCFWVPLAAGRFNLFVPVYLFSLLLLPGLDEPLFIGSLKLVEFSVHDALALGAAVAIFVNPAKAKSRLDWDMVVLAVVFMVSIAVARDTSISHHLRALVETSFGLALPYYIVSRGLRSSEDMRSAMLWLSAGGVVVASVLVFEVWKGWPVYNELFRIYELPTVLMVKVRAGLIRAGGPFVEPTSVAMILAMCALALYLSRDFFRNRPSHVLLLVIVAAGLLAPQSRSAWIGIGIAIVVTDALRGHYAQLAKKLFVVGGAVSCLFLAAQFFPHLSETLGLSGAASETSDYRRLLLQRGLEEFANYPILGQPMSELVPKIPDLVQGEGIIDFVNAYIWVMLIAGLVGLVIFVVPFAYFLISLFRVGRFRGVNKKDAEAGVFVFGVLLMFMEMLFFTSFGMTRPAFYLFALYGFAAAFLRLQSKPKLVVVSTADPREQPRETGLVPLRVD